MNDTDTGIIIQLSIPINSEELTNELSKINNDYNNVITIIESDKIFLKVYAYRIKFLTGIFNKNQNNNEIIKKFDKDIKRYGF